MIFVVRQKVTHAKSDRVFLKISRVIGHDLRHAADTLLMPESNRREIAKSGKTTLTDQLGRKTEIDVIAEEKA